MALLRDWHTVCGRIACESLEDNTSRCLWLAVVEDFSVSGDDRSAIISSIGCGCYSFFQKQVLHLIKHWSSVHLNYQEQLQPGIPSSCTPDDDIALYRLWGFSLFASIRFRKSALTKFCKRYTAIRRRSLAKQLTVLQTLLETDKSILPAVIRLQDRGKMNFPHRILIPLMKKCSIAIKSKVNVQHKSKLIPTCTSVCS